MHVSPDVRTPFPKQAIIAGHSSQKNFGKRCSSHGHRTIDVDVCESYEADCVVEAFRADHNPLSNYYMCTIIRADTSYKRWNIITSVSFVTTAAEIMSPNM